MSFLDDRNHSNNDEKIAYQKLFSVTFKKLSLLLFSQPFFEAFLSSAEFEIQSEYLDLDPTFKKRIQPKIFFPQYLLHVLYNETKFQPGSAKTVSNPDSKKNPNPDLQH